MKKATRSVRKPKQDMLDEYDFSRGVRNTDAERYHEGSNIVLLDDDVADAFPNSESVNSALRVLLKIAQRAKPRRAKEKSSQPRAPRPVAVSRRLKP